MRNISTSLVVVIELLCATAPAAAADPLGNWLTESGNATVAITRCGDALCGTIVALKEPNDPATGKPRTDAENLDAAKRGRPLIGVQIILGMKPSTAADTWVGQVYNAEDGKTYTGSATLTDANTLDLKGCVLVGLICKTQIWTRTK